MAAEAAVDGDLFLSGRRESGRSHVPGYQQKVGTSQAVRHKIRMCKEQPILARKLVVGKTEIGCGDPMGPTRVM